MTNALFNLTGRIAIVTGTSRGLGQYMARALAKSGADIVLTSRHRDSLQAFETEIKSLGRRAVSLPLDVCDKSSIDQFAKDAEAAFGHIDILVNNAGCNVRKPALEVTWDDWNLILDTNLRGSFFVGQAIARLMVPRRYGRIINIGSVTSVAGYAGLGPYGASRGGIRQLTMSLADDWGKFGITVNCLAPGWFRTAQNQVLYETKSGLTISPTAFLLSVPASPKISTPPLSFLLPNPADISPVRLSLWMVAFPQVPLAPLSLLLRPISPECFGFAVQLRDSASRFGPAARLGYDDGSFGDD